VMRLFTNFAMACGIGALAFAAEPVGTASSSAGFELNGVATRSEGVSSWPVAPGDEVRAGGAPVVIRFEDGSRITISEQGRVKLVQNGPGVSVNLTAGRAQFSLAAQSAIKVFDLGREVRARSGLVSTGTPTGGGTTGGPRADIVRQPPPPLSTQ